MWPNLDSRTPYWSPKHCKNTRTNMGTSLKHIIFISENLQFWKCWKVRVPNFWNFRNLNFWKFGKLIIDISCLEIWKYEIGSLVIENMKIESLKITKLEFSGTSLCIKFCEDGHRKTMKIGYIKSPKSWIWLSCLSKNIKWQFGNFCIFKWGNPHHSSTFRLPPLHQNK